MDEIKTGRYRYFKEVAKQSETLEPMAVYQALYGDSDIWVHPAAVWNETVERGEQLYKLLEYIGD